MNVTIARAIQLMALLGSSSLAAPLLAQVPASPTHVPTRAATPTTADAGQAVDAEILVTARRRSESLQDVPISISVLTGDTLAQRAIASAIDLGAVAPGLVVQVGSSTVPAVTVRGLGSSSATPSFEQSVPLFLDGIYAGRSRDFIAPIYDVARVELIKGGQSTLLGKNTTLGALSIVTKTPGSRFSYNIFANQEFVFNSTRIDGGVDLPISDTLAVRAAGLFSSEGGFVFNAATDRDEPRTQIASGRLTARWEATPSLDFTLGYQKDRFRQKGQQTEIFLDRSGTLTNIAATIGQTDFELIRNDRVANGTPVSGGNAYDHHDSDRVHLLGNLALGDFTLSSTTGYMNWTSHRLSDLDFVRAELQTIFISEHNKQFSQEVRLSSPTSKPLTFMVGALYFNQKWNIAQTNTARAPWPRQGAVESAYWQDTTAYSAFGEANYNVGNFTLTGGLRYTDEKKDADFRRTALTPGNLTAVIPLFAPFSDSHAEKNLDGAVNAKYKFNDRGMIYFGWSKGSKSGGFQNSPTNPAVAEYLGEVARTWEGGAKFSVDRHDFNLAIFRTKVDGFQSTRATPNGTIVENLDIISRGVEASATLRPTKNFTLFGSATYADTKNLTNPAVPLSRAPKWSGTIDARFVQPVSQSLNLEIDGTMEFRSSSANSAGAPPNDSFQKYDLRVALANNDAGWEAAIVGRNLTDARPTMFAGTLLYLPAGSFYGVWMRPRTVSLQISFKR